MNVAVKSTDFSAFFNKAFLQNAFLQEAQFSFKIPDPIFLKTLIKEFESIQKRLQKEMKNKKLNSAQINKLRMADAYYEISLSSLRAQLSIVEKADENRFSLEEVNVLMGLHQVAMGRSLDSTNLANEVLGSNVFMPLYLNALKFASEASKK